MFLSRNYVTDRAGRKPNKLIAQGIALGLVNEYSPCKVGCSKLTI